MNDCSFQFILFFSSFALGKQLAIIQFTSLYNLQHRFPLQHSLYRLPFAKLQHNIYIYIYIYIYMHGLINIAFRNKYKIRTQRTYQ